MVTISAGEFEALQAEATIGRQRREINLYRAKSRSRIARDAELASFIVECSDTMIGQQIREACLARFGMERAPSRSAIFRFLQQLRGN